MQNMNLASIVVLIILIILVVLAFKTATKNVGKCSCGDSSGNCLGCNACQNNSSKECKKK